MSGEIKSKLAWRADRKKFRAMVWDPRTGTPTARMFAEKLAAEAWIAETKDVLMGRFGAPKEAMTFGAYADRHFWPRHQGHTEENPRRHFELYVRPRWGQVPLGSIAKYEVKDWIEDLKRMKKGDGKPYSQSYLRQIYFQGFSRIVRSAYDDDALTVLPLPLKVSLTLTKSAKAQIKVLAPHEIEYLAHTIREQEANRKVRYRHCGVVADWPLMHYVLIYTYAFGGLRLSEGLALRVNDLDFDRVAIRVDEQLLRDGNTTPILKRNRSHRLVPMSSMVMDLLRNHVDTNVGWDDPSKLIFVGRFGGPLMQGNWRQRIFDLAASKAGLDITPHSLRHTAATAWHDEGFDTFDIARFLGDTREVVEETYVHYFVDRDERHERMDERYLRGLRHPSNVVPLRRSGEA